MRKFLVLGTICLLAACDGGSRPSSAPSPELYTEADDIVVTGARMKSAPEPVMAETMADEAGDTPAEGADAAVPRQLAYEYSASMRLPAGAVANVMADHQTRCEAAGANVCQVIYANLTEQNADNVYGSLQIRAAKTYMDGFRDGLSGDAEEADGQLVSMTARAEDLTRQITDTEARLNAQKTLRDRLIGLLERETDDVGDLLQIERELARVQSEIESAEGWLKTLRARVAMDKLDIDYRSIPKAVTPQTAQPLKDAFTSFFSDLAWSLAAVIRFIATLIPWLIVIGPGLMLLRAVWRNWRKKG